MQKEENKVDFVHSFINHTINKMKVDNGLAAALRRADNPATEYQSWEHLASFNIEIDKDYRRLPYTTVCAALAKSKVETDGAAGIGACIASCYASDDPSGGGQGQAKLRRLLACGSLDELCLILRSTLTLINSKSSLKLSYGKLLKDLSYFHFNQSAVKAGWAQDYYRKPFKKE